jgi:hypothetical protein
MGGRGDHGIVVGGGSTTGIRRSTNPFDDDYDDEHDHSGEEEEEEWEGEGGVESVRDDANDERPMVGRFWHDAPSTTIERLTTRYCVVLLQLVQYLGRGESWRVASSSSSSSYSTTSTSNGRNRRRRYMSGNPLARELAIDLSYTLLELDGTDMRARLLLPSLLLEGGHLVEAYHYLKRWLSEESSLMIMDLALMMGHDDDETYDDDVGAADPGGGIVETIEATKLSTTTKTAICDVLESPRAWMDGEMVYPSVGMVFELAYLKCHLLCSLRRRRRRSGGGDAHSEEDGDDVDDDDLPLGGDDECELEYQVALLLSVVHRWNPHLLPNLARPTPSSRYDNIEEEIGFHIDNTVVPSPPLSDDIDGTTSAGDGDDGGDGGSKVTTVVDDVANTAILPPALSTLLNARHPGFELQYRMGNPGGGTFDEAVSIWQRDMILWHVVDPMTMSYLVEFCLNLDDNLVDTRVLDGGRTMMAGESSAAADSNEHDGGGNSNAHVRDGDIAEVNAVKRNEAEELVAKLRRERPDRTMDQIMMHPDMAQLMIKHLHMN